MNNTWAEQFYTPSQEAPIGIEHLSIEELASLVEKAEKLLEKKQKECQKEIEDWVDGQAGYGGVIDCYDLKRELFNNPQYVSDMLQRYLDKKGS